MKKLLASLLLLFALAPPATAAELVDELMAIEKTLWTAWGRKDGEPFRKALAANAVQIVAGTAPLDGRDAVVEAVTKQPCELRRFAHDDPRLHRLGRDAVAVSYTATQEATCDGRKLPPKVASCVGLPAAAGPLDAALLPGDAAGVTAAAGAARPDPVRGSRLRGVRVAHWRAPRLGRNRSRGPPARRGRPISAAVGADKETAMAASTIHLKIGDIKGESTDAKHKDEIDVESWSWGASNPGTTAPGGGSGAGRVTFSDLTFTHRFDRASPLLWKACATGQRFRDATLTSARQGKGPQDFLIVRLSDVLVTQVAASESNGAGSGPFESVSMKFGRVDLEYKPQKPDGSLDAGVFFKFDIRTNKEG